MSKTSKKAFEGWLSPKQALQVLKSGGLSEYDAKRMLLARLESGLVGSAARHTETDNKLEKNSFYTVPRRTWGEISEHDLSWRSGDLSYSVRDNFGDNHQFLFFEVRLEPEAVGDIVKATTDLSLPSELPDEIQKGPPVSDAHLRAWYAVYRLVYSGASDTEANALASARGMFPGKSVSRDSVRDLRGPGKRGPKGPRKSGL